MDRSMSVNYAHVFGIYRGRFATAGRHAIPSSKDRIARECFPERWDRLGTAQYVSHTDPTKGWDSGDGYDDYDPAGDSEMPELYPGIDPNEYSFLSWDSQNGVWWVQSPVNGTVGSLWIDYDWENPVYWVGRIGKYWDTFTGDWLLYDEGTVYSGDSFLSAIFHCLTLI